MNLFNWYVSFKSWFLVQLIRMKGGKVLGKIFVEGMPTIIVNRGSVLTVEEGTTIRKGVELRAVLGGNLTISKNIKLDRNVRIIAANKDIVIGPQCRIGIGSIINGGDEIKIGANTLISGYVYIQSSMHKRLAHRNIAESGYEYGAVDIGPGSWLGAHSIVFPNVMLGANTVLGANSLVNKSFEVGATLVGSPARKIN